jgi:hypothetical protein
MKTYAEIEYIQKRFAGIGSGSQRVIDGATYELFDDGEQFAWLEIHENGEDFDRLRESEAKEFGLI